MVEKWVPVLRHFLLSHGISLSVYRNHQVGLSDIHLSYISCKHCLYLPSNFQFCLCGNLHVFVVTTSVIFVLNIGYSHAINIYSLQATTFPPVVWTLFYPVPYLTCHLCHKPLFLLCCKHIHNLPSIQCCYILCIQYHIVIVNIYAYLNTKLHFYTHAFR